MNSRTHHITVVFSGIITWKLVRISGEQRLCLALFMEVGIKEKLNSCDIL